ncbi:MAG: TetR/AcrR family transcriptional regulator [Acholeplasmataceae bacterium]|jgi:AcrR family transcriptional regulator|nr:TetR/AcrR family transcriptional regulator [Acholeplasmataceae bacterium]MDD4193695.1 TetR/AcrR family transcriptional regulator [Acholeplasmataceae bacterium]MDY0338348.1 TetR/AcrR family transcriptional regulator [Acholeplasmataceae bacterium]
MQTKDRIIDVIISHIKKGDRLDKLSIAQIALEADIGKSTLYEYFENKESLISNTYDLLLNHYETILLKPLNEKSFEKQFKEQIELILTVLLDAKEIMDAILNNEQTLYDPTGLIERKSRHIQERIQERFTEIFQKGYHENMIKPLAIPYQKNVIEALMSGLLYQYCTNSIKIKKTELLDLIYRSSLLILNQK